MDIATGIDAQDCFVLHSRDYGDTSQLLEIFCASAGRVGLVARGTRSRRKGQGKLEPFTCINANWRGRQELKTLLNFEHRFGLVLRGDALLCGFYLNELLLKLLSREDPYPALFANYLTCLQQIEQPGADLGGLMREFEMQLLSELGYGIHSENSAEGALIDPEATYYYQVDSGWVGVRRVDQTDSWLGSEVLRLSEGRTGYGAVECKLKRLTRSLIDDLLDGKPLHTRALIKSLHSPRRSD